MKKMRAVMVILLALGLLLLPAAASAASGVQVVDKTGDGEWTDNTWQVDIYPGETKSTTITLYNSSSSSLDVAISVSPDSLDGGNLGFSLDKSSFTMSGKSHTDITLTVKANGSAAPGLYTAELKIKSEAAPVPSGGGGGGISKLRLYGLTVENVTEDSADILWTTSRASTSQVTYWSSPELTIKDESYIREHLVHLEDLEQNTTYYFKLVSRDKYRRKASDEGEFTTLEKEVIPEPEPTPPEPEEPVIIEPIEPTEPEPAPPAPIEKPTPWPLIGGIIGGAILIAAGVIYWRWRRGF